MVDAVLNDESRSPSERPDPVPFTTALLWWLKLGCISFGGPAGQIAIMHRELVESRRWISETRFLHALNYCMVLPGPEAQQLATYIGWLMHGVRGGIAAGVLFVLPSLLLLIGLSWAYVSLGPERAADALYGIRPAVIAIVAFAAWRIGSRVLRRRRLLWPVPVLAFGALALQVPFPAVIALAAVCGAWLRTRLAGDATHATHATAPSRRAAALIDDDTPTPAHAQASPSRQVAVLLVGVLLGATAYALIAAVHGFGSLYNAMAWFFTKAALLTFGGAYAVMPYVFQGAVTTHGWLGAAQMMDGLALGETTPGPLIMVVAFVGFVGAWNGMPAEPLLAGVAGAAVATFFTFLPSFVFIFAGAPWVERTRGNLRLAALLDAVTAAVVGAIAWLALFFAVPVLWPQGWAGGVDGVALGLALLAALGLWRARLGIVPTLLACGLVGAAYRAFVAG